LLYTHIITYPNEKHFESVNMVRQLEVFGILADRERASDIRFPLPIELEEQARAILGRLSVDPVRNFVVSIFPGVLKPHHRWKMEEYADLIRRILEEDERVVVLLMGTPGDRKDVDEVLRITGENGRVKDLAGLTNFGESLGILKATRILVSCDGGAVYMGASMGCATLSFWGPGVMERFKPPGPMHVGVRKEYPCVPCVNYSRLGEFPDCPYNRKCMNEMTASEAFEHYMILKAGIPADDRTVA
jgi:ADP-heptose:LPS heptosyltransferase